MAASILDTSCGLRARLSVDIASRPEFRARRTRRAGHRACRRHRIDVFRVRQLALPAIAAIAIQNNSDMSRHACASTLADSIERGQQRPRSLLLSYLTSNRSAGWVPRLMNSDSHGCPPNTRRSSGCPPGENRRHRVVPYRPDNHPQNACYPPCLIGIEQIGCNADIRGRADGANAVECKKSSKYSPAAQSLVSVSQNVVQEKIRCHRHERRQTALRQIPVPRV